MHTKFKLNEVFGSWDTKQMGIWPLTLICIAKLILNTNLIPTWCFYLIWLGVQITLAHKISGQSDYSGSWDTKQKDIWPLALICIAKMASYQLGVIMWYDRLITIYVHTKL